MQQQILYVLLDVMRSSPVKVDLRTRARSAAPQPLSRLKSLAKSDLSRVLAEVNVLG